MNSPLKAYKHLSLLYAQYNDENLHNQEILRSVSNNFQSSLGFQETLKKYKNFKKLFGFYYDFVVIDHRFGLDLCYHILYINPTQKIIIRVKLYNNENLCDFYVNGFEHFLYEPLSKLSVDKSIHKITEIADYNRLLKVQDDNIARMRQEYEKKLETSQQKLDEKNKFFASMSHEIRTPMNAIIGISQIMTDDHTLNKQQLENIKIISRSSNMLLAIINDILDFSKIEAGKISIEKTSFDLNMILSYLADMISLKSHEKGIKITFEVEHSIAKNYLGDPLRISQVLLNLINNAVKFTDHGHVSLYIRALKSTNKISTLEFEVKDSGIGMKEEQLQKLFQSYTQASSDTSRKYGGTGLGLSIAKQLVKLMDGEIWAQSSYGKGSSFFVNIPLYNGSDSKRNYRLPSKKIMQWRTLIIDSDKESAHSLHNLLDYFHIKADIVLKVDDVQETLNKKRFDLVFVDEDIFNIFNFKAFKKYNSSKIVVLENWINSIKSNNIHNETIDKLLKKPFNQQMIFDILSHLYNVNATLETHKEIDVSLKERVKALGKHKILIAEDNLINQKVIRGLLIDTELEIEFAYDGLEVLEYLQLKQELPRLIFMDINMPNLDGYMTTQSIRKDVAYASLVIIGLSGNSQAEEIQKAKESGMQDYLLKPIQVQELYAVLLKYLSHTEV
ncbi:MAG: ATP-binding protein [Campylobacterota bacterium]|nr:ATP-binding protein [Campylobacterota bacterium]